MISVITTYIALQRSVNIQKKYLKESIKPELEAFLQNHHIDRAKIDKIYKYYGMGVPALLGLLYAMPRGYPINDEERLALTYLGALTGIIDDAFDEDYIRVSRVAAYIGDPASFRAQTSAEHLMVYLGSKVLQHLPSIHEKAFWEISRLVFEQQQQSLLQKHAEISSDQLLSITRDKGGWPFVLYRYCLESPLSLEEQNLVFELGASMQLGNDIFDVYKDLQQGIKTLPTTITEIKHLKTIFEEWMHLTVDKAYKVAFVNKASLRKFLVYYLLGMSRCIVCMEQYQKLEARSGGVFKPMEYDRSELICDMEKWSNILRSLSIFQKMKKRFNPILTIRA